MKRLLALILLSSVFFISLDASAMPNARDIKHYESLAELQNEKLVIWISVADQALWLINDGEWSTEYSISTSKYGIGALAGSFKTPLGLHKIKWKYGDGLEAASVLKGRVATGDVAPIIDEPITNKVDLVTSRVLWLTGLEPGVNKNGNVDSFKRYIYIHGTHEEGLIGQPASKGCIRMHNADVIELFDSVPEGTKVFIAK